MIDGSLSRFGDIIRSPATVMILSPSPDRTINTSVFFVKRHLVHWYVRPETVHSSNVSIV